MFNLTGVSAIKYNIKSKFRSASHLILFILLFLSAVRFLSCTASISSSKFYGSKYYDSDYSMTDKLAYSYSSDLSVKIPEGWFTAEDKECNCIDLWLIRNDFSAIINLMRLNIDPVIAAEITEGNLSKIVDLSKKLKQEKLGDNFLQTKEDEYFELNQNYYTAYEYLGDEELPIRVIVFRYTNKFFELSAMPANKVGKGKVDVQELFRIQQSVLNSIQ